MSQAVFKNRTEAGKELAIALSKYRELDDIVVLGLVRGGVVIGCEIAVELSLPFDVIVARKLGAPFNPELGIGAIAGDVSYYNQALIDDLEVSKDYLKQETKDKQEEAEKRSSLYRGKFPPVNLKGQTVIIADDGIATGVTMHAAIRYIRKQKPAKIILAVPVGVPQTIRKLEKEVEEVICLHLPISMMAVGQFYVDFGQVTDQEVIALMQKVRG